MQFDMILSRFLGLQKMSAKCVHCALLLLTSTFLYAVAMGNISLAVLTCLVICPAFSLATPTLRRYNL